MTVKKRWIGLGLIFLLALAVSAQEPVSNIDFTRENLAQICDSLLADYRQNGEINFETGQGGRGELQLLESVFLQQAAEKGVTVRLDSSGFKIHVETLKIKIEYAKTGTATAGYNDDLLRKLRVELHGWVEDYASSRKQGLNLEKTTEDRIPAHRLSALESNEYDFLKGTKVPGGFWQKFVEPVIVIGSVGVVVFLFFSQRT